MKIIGNGTIYSSAANTGGYGIIDNLTSEKLYEYLADIEEQAEKWVL